MEPAHSRRMGVINVTWDDLTRRPAEVADRIRQALGENPLFR